MKKLSVLIFCLMYGVCLGQDIYPFVHDGLWGYVDEAGKVIIKPQYLYAESFEQEKALIANKDSLYYFIDRKGEFLIKEGFKQAFSFCSNGYAVIQQQDNKWGILNPKGTVIATTDVYESIHYELAMSYFRGVSNGKMTLLDSMLNIVNQEFSHIVTIMDTVAIVSKNGKNFGVVNKDFKALIPLNYAEIAFQDETFCAFKSFYAPYGVSYFNYLGEKLALSHHLIKGEVFNCGLAKVLINEGSNATWCLIDTNGKIIKNNIDESLYLLDCKTGNYIYLDKSTDLFGLKQRDGKIIVKPVFFSLKPLKGNKNLLKGITPDNTVGAIDWKGREVVPFDYDNLSLDKDLIKAVKYNWNLSMSVLRTDYLHYYSIKGDFLKINFDY